MARIRTIKPEFWTDEKLAPLSPVTRLTFLGLVSMADDAGRINDSVKLLDGLLFSETDDSVGDSLEELESIGVIHRGQSSGGKRIIQVVGWLKHQKIEKANLKAALPEIVRRQVDDKSGKRSNLPKDVRDAILKHDDYKCCECGVVVILEKDDRYDSRDELAEIDHIVALADGGSDEPENMRTLCKKCNRRKQGKELAKRNRRQVGEESGKNSGNVDDASPPRPTTYDLRPTIMDQRSTTKEQENSSWKIPSNLDTPEVRTALERFAAMRKRIKKPIKDFAAASVGLKHFDSAEHLVYAADFCVANDYQGLKPDYKPLNNGKANSGGKIAW